MSIHKVGVIGTGNMGRQISVLCAMHGYITTCYDINDEIMAKMKDYVVAYLDGRVAKGKITEDEKDLYLHNLSYSTDLEEAVKEADIVIEAVLEDIDLKREIFAKLDRFTKPETILATNSSTILSSKIADAVGDSSRVCNMHFFNPALVMKTVEVVRGPHTAEDTVKTAYEFCKTLGKTPVMLNKEVDGFCVNTILAAISGASFRLLDDGVISPEDLDIAVKGALGHPMGPCELVDLTGIDLEYYVWKARYEKSHDERDRIPHVIAEKYEKGEYGRKTGKGFYEYK